MKFRYLLIAVAIFTTGCANEQSTTTSAGNDLVAVDAPNKLLTASNVDLTEPYYFAYQESPVENYDTYGTSKPVSITADSATTLSIYGSDEALDSVPTTDPYVMVDVKAGESYIFESSFDYYVITSSQPTTAVVSVS